MARRKQNTFEDVIEITSKLPGVQAGVTSRGQAQAGVTSRGQVFPFAFQHRRGQV